MYLKQVTYKGSHFWYMISEDSACGHLPLLFWSCDDTSTKQGQAKEKGGGSVVCLNIPLKGLLLVDSDQISLH